ncbi:MAG: hypothetical protein OEZ58_15745 [Gammaproteobacteria bacterium]|nr:hypothetical protein [Gammaproteobacteria bacterium]MDH5730445.1 hypothetical protein [Gammaproteobacteria bacterium]
MNKFTQITNKSFSLCLLFLVFFYASAASASSITRSCDGKYYVQKASSTATETLEVFNAVGSCSSLSPNNCRDKARVSAHTCMQVHWDDRWSGVKPDICKPIANVFDYSIQDLKNRIENKVCNRWKPMPGSSVRVKLYRQTSGQTTCNHTAFVSEYVVYNNMC